MSRNGDKNDEFFVEWEGVQLENKKENPRTIPSENKNHSGEKLNEGG